MSLRDAEIEAQADFHAHEMNVDGGPAERRWSRWLDAAEKLAIADGGFRQDCGPKGSPLDGDEPSGDTYSLDGAYDAFERGESPADYVAGCIVLRTAPKAYFEAAAQLRNHSFDVSPVIGRTGEVIMAHRMFAGRLQSSQVRLDGVGAFIEEAQAEARRLRERRLGR